MKLPASIIVVSAIVLSLTGCLEDQNQVSQSGAQQAKPSIVPLNSKGVTCEQQNIDQRIQVTSNPTKVMWIHLISLNGEIIKRMPVRNKVTSSSKRLEPNTTTGLYVSSATNTMPRFGDWTTSELIGPDGTYGSSDPYIYWFDPMNRYHQWGTAGGMGYLLTDYPIDLENPIDKITGLYQVQAAAARWQSEQEAKLKTAEKQ